jgi:ABC-type amino acid transport substrate-binding protein
MKYILLALAALGLSACANFPTDPDSTLDRVRSSHVFRVGIIAGGWAGPQQAFLAGLSKATGARPQLFVGPAELVLTDLEAGKLDLVLGAVAPDSPWAAEVSFLQPIGEQPGERRLLLIPMAKNGENAWIMLVERQARLIRSRA